jgi:L-ribulose-5-phosphate 3-epimerase
MSHSSMTRRQMLVGTAGLVAGLSLSSCSTMTRSSSRGRGFKLAVCDWTVGQATNPASLEIAQRIGLDGVQVDFGGGEQDLPLFDPSLQRRFLEASRQYQVEIASLAMGVLNNVPYKSDPRAEPWVARAIDVSKAMDTKVILMAFFGKGDLVKDDKGVDTVVARLRRVAPKAEKAGVILGIESQLSAEQHLDILRRVGSPAVRVYYDVANSQGMGYDIDNEIRTLGRQICEFHAKDNKDLYGKGSIDFVKVRQAVDDIGYRGWLVMEGTQMPLGVEESCRYDAQYLRGVFPPKG